jgi:hypothetical protein
LTAESLDFLRSSTIQLEGDRAARMHSMLFKSLPGGVYRIRVRLDRADGDVLVREDVVDVKDGR